LEEKFYRRLRRRAERRLQRKTLGEKLKRDYRKESSEKFKGIKRRSN
jgi:hypothetical protein